MKSYVVLSTISFEDSKFYVRPGDILSHDPRHGNSLAIYRGGTLITVMKTRSFVIEAFLKSRFIQEVVAPPLPPPPLPSSPSPSPFKKRKRDKPEEKKVGELRLDGVSETCPQEPVQWLGN